MKQFLLRKRKTKKKQREKKNAQSSSLSKVWAFPPKKPFRKPLFWASGVSIGVNSSPSISCDEWKWTIVNNQYSFYKTILSNCAPEICWPYTGNHWERVVSRFSSPSLPFITFVNTVIVVISIIVWWWCWFHCKLTTYSRLITMTLCYSV